MEGFLSLRAEAVTLTPLAHYGAAGASDDVEGLSVVLPTQCAPTVAVGAGEGVDEGGEFVGHCASLRHTFPSSER